MSWARKFWIDYKSKDSTFDEFLLFSEPFSTLQTTQHGKRGCFRLRVRQRSHAVELRSLGPSSSASILKITRCRALANWYRCQWARKTQAGLHSKNWSRADPRRDCFSTSDVSEVRFLSSSVVFLHDLAFGVPDQSFYCARARERFWRRMAKHFWPIFFHVRADPVDRSFCGLQFVISADEGVFMQIELFPFFIVVKIGEFLCDFARGKQFFVVWAFCVCWRPRVPQIFSDRIFHKLFDMHLDVHSRKRDKKFVSLQKAIFSFPCLRGPKKKKEKKRKSSGGDGDAFVCPFCTIILRDASLVVSLSHRNAASLSFSLFAFFVLLSCCCDLISFRFAVDHSHGMNYLEFCNDWSRMRRRLRPPKPLKRCDPRRALSGLSVPQDLVAPQSIPMCLESHRVHLSCRVRSVVRRHRLRHFLRRPVHSGPAQQRCIIILY